MRAGYHHVREPEVRPLSVPSVPQSDTGGGGDGDSVSSALGIAAEVPSCHNDDCAKSRTRLCFMNLECS
eukprot:5376549-Prorocentrum_lima.AAC.1